MKRYVLLMVQILAALTIVLVSYRSARLDRSVEVRFRSAVVNAEVASTPSQLAQGLMGRPEVPAGTGMLFVLPEVTTPSFWMKNTPVALSIAFLDGSGVVVDIQDMVPLSEDPVTSKAPARYALEVPAGWFEEQGVVVGDTAFIPDWKWQ